MYDDVGGWVVVLHLKKYPQITHVLNAAKGLEMFGPKYVRAVEEASHTCTFLRLDWIDTEGQEIAGDVERIVRFIHKARTAGHSVLVHCAQGKSRSSTALLLYLLAARPNSDCLTVETALAFLKSKRQSAEPNPGFLSQLQAVVSREKFQGLQKEFAAEPAVVHLTVVSAAADQAKTSAAAAASPAGGTGSMESLMRPQDVEIGVRCTQRVGKALQALRTAVTGSNTQPEAVQAAEAVDAVFLTWYNFIKNTMNHHLPVGSSDFPTGAETWLDRAVAVGAAADIGRRLAEAVLLSATRNDEDSSSNSSSSSSNNNNNNNNNNNSSNTNNTNTNNTTNNNDDDKDNNNSLNNTDRQTERTGLLLGWLETLLEACNSRTLCITALIEACDKIVTHPEWTRT